MSFITVFFQRLKSFPIRENISEDDQADNSSEPLIFTGAIYGMQIDPISELVITIQNNDFVFSSLKVN